MNELKVINPEGKIAESNKLIREMFDFTVTKRQFDLIYVIISLVTPSDTKFTEYKLSYETIAKIFNPKNPRTEIIQKDVEHVIKDIMNSCFRIKTENNIDDYYHWVEKAKNYKDKKYIVFKLNEEVQQFYLQLKEGEYTIYLLKDLLALSTLFQANLFRWLSSNGGFKNNVKISIDDAKVLFYGNKELTTKKLTVKLNSALDVINRKTNIEASYNQIKEGKKIAYLEFKIENNYKLIEKLKPTKSPEQFVKEAQRKKAMWQENIEMKNKIMMLEKELAEIKGNGK